MNAPLLNLFASPQGAGLPAGAAAPTGGVLGVFDALLAAMTGETPDLAPTQLEAMPAEPEAAQPADPTAQPPVLAALFTPAPLPQASAPQGETAEAAATFAPAAPVPAMPEAAAPQAAPAETPEAPQAVAPEPAPTDAWPGVRTAPPTPQAAKAEPQSLNPEAKAPAAPDTSVQAATPAPAAPSSPAPAAAPAAASPMVLAEAAPPPPAPLAEAKPQKAEPAKTEAQKTETRTSRAEGKPAAPSAPVSPAATPDDGEAVAPAMADDGAIDLADAGTPAAAPEPPADAPDEARPHNPTPAASAAPASNAAQALAAHAPAVAVRGAPETVARLAAGLLQKLETGSTRFEIGLDPSGLGHVDVRLEIAADGTLTAQLAFDTPHAAAELRGRAGELRQALEQAGFELSKNSLSFDVTGQGQQHQREQAERQPRRGGRAFEAVMASEDEIAAPTLQRRISGVDIRI